MKPVVRQEEKKPPSQPPTPPQAAPLSLNPVDEYMDLFGGWMEYGKIKSSQFRLMFCRNQQKLIGLHSSLDFVIWITCRKKVYSKRSSQSEYEVVWALQEISF